MALENFIPEVWSARLLENLHRALVFGGNQIINRDYEGEIQQAGDTVRIRAIGAVTVGDYTKNSTIGNPQVLSDAQAMLTIDQQKYFNFQIDDVDAAQQMPKVMDAAMREAAYAMANVADQFIASKYVDVAVGNTVGTDASPILVDGSGTAGTNLYERLVDQSTVLDENDVPAEGRWIVLPPKAEGLLLKDQRFVSYGTSDNLNRAQNGQIGRIAGFDIYKSNNVPTVVNGSSQTVYQIVGGHNMGWSFADQVNKVVAYRPEQRFADAMKGLHLFGAKVVQPHALCLLKARFA